MLLKLKTKSEVYFAYFFNKSLSPAPTIFPITTVVTYTAALMIEKTTLEMLIEAIAVAPNLPRIAP